MRRMRRNHGSKWESSWVSCYGRGQVDQGEVLDDCCYMTFASGAFCSGFEGHIIIIAFFFGRELC